MNTIKIIVFVIGVFLINFVVGFPYDARNIFITHTIFYVPYILEFHRLLIIQFDRLISWVIKIIYAIGIGILIMNTLGILGVITIDADSKILYFSESYVLPFSINIAYNNYILTAGIVYAVVFIGSMLFEHLIFLQEEANREPNSEGVKTKRTGVTKHVSNG